jgi:thiamine biosynthesis lipoprotein
LWKFGETQPQKPEVIEIKNRLSLVNYQNVQLETSQIKFSQKNMAIDLGGIAKGTAIDAAVDQLKNAEMKDFMIDAGGDLAIHSSKLTQGKIRVWIRHPRKPEILFGYFYLNNGFVATSGDYEQYFQENGQRFHHIINPKTGFPDSDLISVTVIAKTAELADAYSTGIFVMGRENGIRFVKNHPEIEAVLLSKGKEKINYWASESIMEKIHIVDDSIL